jgi:hypothetical protein
VIDDGSTDRTWEILSRVSDADSRIRPFRHAGKEPQPMSRIRPDRKASGIRESARRARWRARNPSRSPRPLVTRRLFFGHVLDPSRSLAGACRDRIQPLPSSR